MCPRHAIWVESSDICSLLLTFGPSLHHACLLSLDCFTTDLTTVTRSLPHPWKPCSLDLSPFSLLPSDSQSPSKCQCQLWALHGATPWVQTQWPRLICPFQGSKVFQCLINLLQQSIQTHKFGHSNYFLQKYFKMH